MITEQQIYAGCGVALLLSFLVGRATVSDLSHTDECRPEIESIAKAQRTIADMEKACLAAEQAALTQCVEREQQICQRKLEESTGVSAELDCIICAGRCPGGAR